MKNYIKIFIFLLTFSLLQACNNSEYSGHYVGSSLSKELGFDVMNYYLTLSEDNKIVSGNFVAEAKQKTAVFNIEESYLDANNKLNLVCVKDMGAQAGISIGFLSFGQSFKKTFTLQEQKKTNNGIIFKIKEMDETVNFIRTNEDDKKTALKDSLSENVQALFKNLQDGESNLSSYQSEKLLNAIKEKGLDFNDIEEVELKISLKRKTEKEEQELIKQLKNVRLSSLSNDEIEKFIEDIDSVITKIDQKTDLNYPTFSNRKKEAINTLTARKQLKELNSIIENGGVLEDFDEQEKLYLSYYQNHDAKINQEISAKLLELGFDSALKNKDYSKAYSIINSNYSVGSLGRRSEISNKSERMTQLAKSYIKEKYDNPQFLLTYNIENHKNLLNYQYHKFNLANENPILKEPGIKLLIEAKFKGSSGKEFTKNFAIGQEEKKFSLSKKNQYMGYKIKGMQVLEDASFATKENKRRFVY